MFEDAASKTLAGCLGGPLRHYFLAVVLAVACGSGPEKTPSPGQTGALGVVTVGGKQKLYLPLASPNAGGHGVIAVVDVGVAGRGVAGSPALITDIDLGTADIARTTAADPDVVIAAWTKNRTIW